PPHGHIGSARMYERKSLWQVTSFMEAFAQKLVFFPESFAKSEYDLADLSRFQPFDYFSLLHEVRPENNFLCLQHGVWDGNDDGAGFKGVKCSPVTAAAISSYMSFFPNELGDNRVQAQF